MADAPTNLPLALPPPKRSQLVINHGRRRHEEMKSLPATVVLLLAALGTAGAANLTHSPSPSPDPLTPTQDPLTPTQDPLTPTQDPLTPTQDPLTPTTSRPTNNPTTGRPTTLRPTNRPTTGRPTTFCGGTGSCSINPDPHFNIWDPGFYYDFQGGCDMIAIDNPVLQVQIRTRPRRYYSTITQLAIKIKATGEVFRVHEDGRVENAIGNSGAGPASYSLAHLSYGRSRHTISLGSTTPASYIRVFQSLWGMSMTAYGCAAYFAGSEGMCGSWDSNGLRHKDGTVMDLSGGYHDRKNRATALAKSWMVDPADSLLWDPSEVCDPSSRCGTGSNVTFPCDATRRLQDVLPTCTRTCADIGIPQFVEQCEVDVQLSGDPSWACTDAYVDPVVATDRVYVDPVVATNTIDVPHVGVPGGCYDAYVDGKSYKIGDWVSFTVITTSAPSYTRDPLTGGWITKTETTKEKRNYKCISNDWCGRSGYGPGSVGESLAWQKDIKCSGIAIPATASTPPLWNAQGGCPKTYKAGTIHAAGDVVSVDNLVYQCASEPTNLFCGMTGYAPNKDQYWEVAWSIIGSCTGTLSPTSSPVYVTLQDLGGCPKEWEARSAGEAYEEGDQVSAEGLVFACKSFPFTMHCGQQGYEPLTNPATPDAWKMAWEVIGYCDGIRSPTSSPNFDPASFVGICPEEWSSGSIVKYEEGDMVSAVVSSTPLRKVAFRCKAWPFSGHCGQFSPTNKQGGSLGWSIVGSCGGSIGPTASPSFVKLAVSTSGCPNEYSASVTNYEAGDMVARTVSTVPLHRIVYKCRVYPNTGFCNQSGFHPGSQYDHMAWTLVGACSGTLTPTAAPAAYVGRCKFNKCMEVDDTEQCAPGSTGCSCKANDAAGPSCQRDIKRRSCNDVDVNPWSSSVDYDGGDVVRIGAKRFKCRMEWPNKLWCSAEAYMPTLEKSGIWHQAWTENGTCM